jgi:hypothetical protein
MRQRALRVLATPHQITTSSLSCMDRDDNKRQTSGHDSASSQADEVRRRMAPWRRIGEQLVPLIGELGFCALFGRAARLLAARYDWIGAAATGKSAAALLAALEQAMAAVDPAEARVANAELLATFTRQLTALVGEALTARLLETAEDRVQGPDDAQEQK